MKRRIRLSIVLLVALNLVIAAIVLRDYLRSTKASHRAQPSPEIATVVPPPAKASEPKAAVPFQPLAVSLKRWAILASPEVQKSGVSDRLIAALSTREDIELVEREALAAATRELKFAELLGSQSTTGRLKLGQLLHADLLVFLSIERSGTYESLRVAFSESKYGCRLGVDFIPWMPETRDQVIKQVEIMAHDRARMFQGGIQHLIGVSKFINQTLTGTFNRLQSQLSDVLENGLTAHPGVAVLETDEAQAMGRESLVRGEEAGARVLPLWVDGEYEMLPARDDKPVGVRLKLVLRNGSGTVKELSFARVDLDNVAKLMAEEISDEILKASNASAAATFDRPDQARDLAARAKTFAEIGSLNQAVRLYETAVLLDQSNVTLRMDLIATSKRQSQELVDRLNNGRLTASVQILADMSRHLADAYLRRLEHVEYLLANRLCDYRQAEALFRSEQIGTRRLSDYLLNAPKDIFARDRQECETARRELVLTYYPLLQTWEPSSSRDDHNWWLSGFLGALLNDSRPARWNEEDLRLFLRVLREYVKDSMTINHQVIRLLEQYPTEKISPNGWRITTGDKWNVSNEQFRKFLDELEHCPQQLVQYYGRYGRFYRDWKQCDPQDTAKLNSLIKQVEAFLVELRANPPTTAIQKPIERDPHYKHLIQIKQEMLRALNPALTSGERRKLPELMPRTKLPTVEAAELARARRKAQIWNSIPRLELKPLEVRVKLSLGQEVPFRKASWKFERVPDGWPRILGIHRIVPCDDKFDLLWSPAGIYVMHDPGLATHVFSDRDAFLSDVKWDGENLWVATAFKGIAVVDLSGKVLYQFGKAQGLPPHEHGACVQPIGPGKAIAAGSFGEKSRGWCAVLERGDPPVVEVFHQGIKEWVNPESGDVEAVDVAFRPRMIFDFPCTKDKSRQLLVARYSADNRPINWISIDPELLKVKVIDFRGQMDITRPSAGMAIVGDSLVCAGMKGIQNAITPWQDVEISTNDGDPYVLSSNGQLVIPGKAWQRVDAKGLTLIPGKLTGIANSRYYGVSVHYGIVGWSQGESLIQITVPQTPFEDPNEQIAREDAATNARAKPKSVKIECPVTYRVPSQEIESLIAKSQAILDQPPDPLPDDAVTIYPDGLATLDRWIDFTRTNLWIDPPTEEPRAVMHYVRGRLMQIDDKRRGVVRTRIWYNKEGAPVMAINDFRKPDPEDHNPHTPWVQFVHATYDDRGYLSRQVFLRKSGDGLIRESEVILHRYRTSYRDGYAAEYFSDGTLHSYRKFLPTGELQYINPKTGALTYSTSADRLDEIKSLVRFGLEPFYPIPKYGDRTEK